ncbi:amino acid adenylation domain-containing protein, partial [Amycolatopsis sp. NPDC059027]|uniref:amino acid adenylation domain-containing protein n=1 Tax=Amycolatopsis sp. NPDC059027 TaxID=3346709 RepID=UPI003671A198
MSVRHLIDELERAGVRLWAESGQLKFRAPKGVLTEERISELRRQKSEILRHLAEDAEPELSSDPEHRHEPFPLTDVQAAYLFGRHDGFAYGGVACHGYAELELPDVRPERLETALRKLIERHDMLRAVVHPDGYQYVRDTVPDYEIGVRDLRGADAGQLADALTTIRDEMSHRVYRTDRWPLFELCLTHTGQGAIVHLSIDLLIADFMSIQLLLGELSELYREPDRVLPPVPVTFRDYVLAERKGRSGSRYHRDRRYWLDRVGELPGAPELPLASGDAADAAAPAGGSGTARFRRLHAEIEPELWSALRKVSSANGVTVSGAVLAAYAEVIGRWSRSPRFTLNLTLLNRLPLHPDVGKLIGDFTSVSLLATDLTAGDCFRDRARHLHAQLRKDLSHRTFSGVEVMREISRRKDAAAALMPVVFTSTLGGNTGDIGDKLLGARLGYGISQTPQVWIDCQASERDGTLLINWDVREGVLPGEVIEAGFAAFTALLRELATGEQAWSDACPVPLPPAQRDSRTRFNATETTVPDGLLHEPVLAQARRTPDRPAVISEARTLCYDELVARATAVAGALRSGGCRQGDVVAVFMDKGWEQVVGVFGVLLAGGAYLPVDTNQPAARRSMMLAGAGVRQVLTQSWLTGDPAPDGVDLLAVDTIEPAGGPAEPPASERKPDELAYVIYTSGSSGVPKGVMISHRSALNTIADINERFAVTEDDRVLGLANLGFDLSVYDLFGPLAVGGCLVLPSAERRSDPSHWAESVAAHDVTLWNSVPAQLQMLQHYLDAEPDLRLPSLRLAMLSGDWIPVALPDQIRARVPELRLISLGGATEAAIWSIHHPIGEVPPEWHSIPYGTPLANQTFHVLDDRFHECPDWTAGELYIGGAGLAIGYLGDEEKTRQRFVRHPVTGERLYRTGDLGRHLPSGVIEFLGREDFQVKIRGHRIELAEVDAALGSFPGLASAVALVAGSDAFDRRLVAFVEAAKRDQADPADAEHLSALRTAAGKAASAVADGVDPGLLGELVRLFDDVALRCMAKTLREHDLFGSPGRTHELPEILEAVKAAPRHHRLLRRWLNVLEREGMLSREPDTGRYHGLREIQPGEIDALWQRMEVITEQVGYGEKVMHYLKISSERLPELMRDELDPLALLFPEGRFDTAEAAYKDNLLSRYLNQVTIAVLRELAAERPSGKPLRVLEVGAGVGGTSAELIPALDEFTVDYHFTDVSRFFLNEAEQRYRAYPWVRYGLFDLNQDYRAQGYPPNSVDVLVCNNVLHNGREAGEMLARLREALAPGGWLVFIESTKDNYQLMVSMEFKEGLTDFVDFRQSLDQTFITRAQWQKLLDEAGAETVVCLPEQDDVWSGLGQHVFAARFKSGQSTVDVEAGGGARPRRPPTFVPPAGRLPPGPAPTSPRVATTSTTR